MIPPDARFVVTGPTGWIGRAFLAHLGREMGDEARERVTCLGASARVVGFDGMGETQVRALDSLSPADTDGAYVIHLAYLGGEQARLRPAAEFARLNAAIDERLLDALPGGPPRGVFVSSSGMAGAAAAGAASLYGACKLLQEARFLQPGAVAGARLLIGRIFNVAGPYINKVGDYALGSFLTQARDEGTIRISAPVPVFRSYLHVADVVRLVLGELAGEDGLPAGPCDLAGPLVTEMQDVALAAAQAAGLGPERITRPPVDLARPNRYLGDPAPARIMALRHGVELASFARQVADTARHLGLPSGRGEPR